MMIASAFTTSKEELQERLKEMNLTPLVDLEGKASSDSENVLQDNQDDCYERYT